MRINGFSLQKKKLSFIVRNNNSFSIVRKGKVFPNVENRFRFLWGKNQVFERFNCLIEFPPLFQRKQNILAEILLPSRLFPEKKVIYFNKVAPTHENISVKPVWMIDRQKEKKIFFLT